MGTTQNRGRAGPPNRRPPQQPPRRPEPEPQKRRKRVAEGTAQRAEQRRRRKRRRLILFYIVMFLVVVIGAVTLSLTVLFKIDTIQVTGTSRYTAQEIVNTAGIPKGENLFLAKTKEAGTAIEKKLPYIKTAKVSRRFPAKIVIDVVEDTVSGVIVYEDRYAVLGENGKVLDFPEVIPEGVPVIKGLMLSKVELGEPIAFQENDTESEASEEASSSALQAAGAEEQSDEAASEDPVQQRNQETYETLMQAITDNGLDKISEIDLTDPYNLKILYDNRITMVLGLPTDLDYKIHYAKGILDEGGIQENERGVLNLADAVNNKVPFAPDYTGGTTESEAPSG